LKISLKFKARAEERFGLLVVACIKHLKERFPTFFGSLTSKTAVGFLINGTLFQTVGCSKKVVNN
jgi:hypothetical protein